MTVHELIDEVYWRQEARENATRFPEDVTLVQAQAWTLGIELTPEEAAAIYGWYSSEIHCATWVFCSEKAAEEAVRLFLKAAGYPPEDTGREP